jgi:quercetin dioxygenase-like cupin family protein
MAENDQKTCQDILEIQSVRLVDMIQYQTGAVVSRTILDKKTGTVTLFAFDQGQGLSEHTAPFDAMVHVIDGEAEISIEGQPHGVKAGEMILMPANHPHAVRAIQRFKMLLVMIRS